MNDKLKAYLKYYVYMINVELEYINGLEKYNINNQELEDHYLSLSGLIQSAYSEIINDYDN